VEAERKGEGATGAPKEEALKEEATAGALKEEALKEEAAAKEEVAGGPLKGEAAGGALKAEGRALKAGSALKEEVVGRVLPKGEAATGAALAEARRPLMPFSSTSNTKSAFGPITGGEPRVPYPHAAEIRRIARSPSDI
jgi:hypothetical protein